MSKLATWWRAIGFKPIQSVVSNCGILNISQAKADIRYSVEDIPSIPSSQSIETYICY